ncbi:MAG TPA: 2-hydroxyacid dehydrogenase [Anaerolineae bacterium]
MKVAVFSTKHYDRAFLEVASKGYDHELVFFEPRITPETVSLAQGFPAICIFVNDFLNAAIVETLAGYGVRLVALRSAGFNNVDLAAAQRHNLTVVRVPAYSPHSVAEHTVALLLAVNRKTHRAYARVREGNFSLEGLLGFEVRDRTVGIIGTGKIGAAVAEIMHGFGCNLVAYDIRPNPVCLEMGVSYISLPKLFAESDIITLHSPLTPQTYHLIDAEAIAQMKTGVTIINTSRGALVDTLAVIEGLKSGKIGHLALDVYEEEADLFFEDLSDKVIQDDVFARLLTFPNVIITGHQAFFTREALWTIADVTLANIAEFEQTGTSVNEVRAEKVIA